MIQILFLHNSNMFLSFSLQWSKFWFPFEAIIEWKDAYFFKTHLFTTLKSGRTTQSTHMHTYNSFCVVKSFVFGNNTFLFLVFSFVRSFIQFLQPVLCIRWLSYSTIQHTDLTRYFIHFVHFCAAWDFFLRFFSVLVNTMCVLCSTVVYSNFKIPLPANVKTRMQ